MKKIIDGKKYDTETAQLMGEWKRIDETSFLESGLSVNQFYKKKNGEIFEVHFYLASEEGSEPEEITFDSEESNVRADAEFMLTGDEYEAIYGPVEE